MRDLSQRSDADKIQLSNQDLIDQLAAALKRIDGSRGRDQTFFDRGSTTEVIRALETGKATSFSPIDVLLTLNRYYPAPTNFNLANLTAKDISLTTGTNTGFTEIIRRRIHPDGTIDEEIHRATGPSTSTTLNIGDLAISTARITR